MLLRCGPPVSIGQGKTLYPTVKKPVKPSLLACSAERQVEVEVEWDSSSDFEEQDTRLQWAVNLSLAGNIALLLVKTYAFIVSGSFAVLDALADSVVDLASQVVLFFCNR